MNTRVLVVTFAALSSLAALSAQTPTDIAPARPGPADSRPVDSRPVESRPLDSKPAAAVTEPLLVDQYTIRGPRHYGTGYPARAESAAGGELNQPRELNVVVEIPTGTTAKWEVDERSGLLCWEFKNGEPRVVQYLGYPGNYGMIPSTLQPADDGGDGDPLDVLVLGDPLPRGSVIRARVIGVLKLRDGGERDDKLIAVRDGTPFAEITDLAALRRARPGTLEIIETWFANYKGPGEIVADGFADRAAAELVIDAAIRGFETHRERARGDR